jgi:hypothetical protein
MHSTALSAIAFNNVVRHLGYAEPCFMHDVVQQLALTRPCMRERFHVDIVDLSEAFLGDPVKDWKLGFCRTAAPAAYPPILICARTIRAIPITL